MELDLLVIGSGPGGQKAAIQAAKLGKRVAVAERRDRLGGVSIHTGHDPVQDAAPGGARAARHAAARRARPDAGRGDRAPGDPAAARPRRRRRRRRDRRSRASSSGATTSGCCPATRASRTTTRSSIDGADEPIRAGADRDRRRHAAGAAGLGRVRRPHDHRLRRAAQAREPRAAHDDRRRRRRDRRRVRVDVRRARDQGDRRRPARPRALVPRHRDRRGVPVPAAAQQRDVPAAREGRRGRGARRAAARGCKLASGKEIVSETVLYATGRQGDTEHLGLDGDRAGDRQARADQGRRELPHRGPAHLRGRRLRGRRARRDGDGAGPDRRAARVRPAGADSCRS